MLPNVAMNLRKPPQVALLPRPWCRVNFTSNFGTATVCDFTTNATTGFQVAHKGSGGAGSLDLYNITSGASNPHKYFRVGSGGTLNILNSAFSNNIWNLTDAGAVTQIGPTFYNGSASGSVAVEAPAAAGTGAFLLVAGIAGAMIPASFTTTGATTDHITITGMTSSGHCTLQATNSTAAGMASVYVSAKTSNQITVTHPSTAGGTFDIHCTPN
jgi:hypothetical protein